KKEPPRARAGRARAQGGYWRTVAGPPPLREADGGAVAGVANVEGAGGRGAVAVRAPAGRTRGDGGQEGARRLTERVGHDGGEVGEGSRQRAHVGGVDADGGGEGPGIGLGLGQPRARLDVGVERDGDSGEDADDGYHDHQLDEREAALLSTDVHVRWLLLSVRFSTKAARGQALVHTGCQAPKCWNSQTIRTMSSARERPD